MDLVKTEEFLKKNGNRIREISCFSWEICEVHTFWSVLGTLVDFGCFLGPSGWFNAVLGVHHCPGTLRRYARGTCQRRATSLDTCPHFGMCWDFLSHSCYY